MKLKYLSQLAALIIILIFSSCGRKSDVKTGDVNNYTGELAPVDTSGAAVGDWIIQRELADPQKLNPITVQDATGMEITLYLFEKLLFAADRKTMDPLPWLAESLPTVSDDHLVYTFKLKKNIIFSNGRPLTGDDVIFSFKAMKNPLVDDAALRNYYASLKKAELVDGDKFTIRFTLSKPYFKAMLVLGDLQIMSKEIADPEHLTDKYSLEECDDIATAQKNPALKKFSDFFNSEEMNRVPKNLIGSGPYIFEQWETGQFVKLQRNDKYWNQSGNFGMAYPKRLVIKVIQDEASAIVAAKNKEIDLMYVMKPVDYVRTIGDPQQFNMKKADPTEPRFDYIGYNMKNPIFADVRVRWAMAYMVDRNSIIEKIHFGMAVPISGPVYFQDKKHFNPDLPLIPFDPEKAKQLLSETGWKDSDGDGVLDKTIDGKKVDFKFTYLLNTNESRKMATLVIIDALKKIGIVADLQTLEWSVYLDKIKKHEFDATMGAWTLSDYPPDEFQIFHSSQSQGEGSNFTSFKNEEADRLMEQYRQEFDETTRIEIIKKLQKIFYDDQAYTFTWTPKAKYIYGDRFKNVRWYPTPLTSYQLTEWWVPVNSQKYQSQN